jgi:hypothetical protein
MEWNVTYMQISTPGYLFKFFNTIQIWTFMYMHAYSLL